MQTWFYLHRCIKETIQLLYENYFQNTFKFVNVRNCLESHQCKNLMSKLTYEHLQL